MDHKNQKRITLKNIKYMASLSRETHCYTADIYFDGVKCGTTGNDGHGGCDDYQPLACGERVNGKRRPVRQKCWDAMMNFVASFDSTTSTLGGLAAISLQPDLEWVCSDLINEWLALKELKKFTSKRVIYTIKGKPGIYQTKTIDAVTRERWAAEIGRRETTDQVLNAMPIPDALALFQERTA